MDSHSTLVLGCSVALLGVVLGVRWALLPRPYEGIPYNRASARRINGDISEVAKNYKKTNEFSRSLFNVSTSVQGTPVAQVLFPNFRRPLIMIDDPREVEDILVRRHAEFDRAPMVTNLFIPFWPEASLSQRTTPKLRAQKRVWADVMNPAFLRKVAAPNIHKATLELLNLWRLKTIANDGQAFRVADDFLNAELDVIWVAIVGEEPGITRYKLEQLRCEYAGKKQNQTPEEIERQKKAIPIPAGLFLRDEIGYVEGVIARNALAPIPKLAQQIETWKPRFRKFKSSISSGITTAMIKSIERFQRLETGSLETDDEDTCMMDLVLRRKIVESRKTGKPLKDPTQDQEMLDEMFIMLTGGHDSTANTLSWFVRFMTVNPSIQKELREILRQHFPGTETPSAHEILDADIPFLDAVCHETLRVAGTARATSRIVTQDTEILGYPIPKDSTIFLNLHITESPFEVSESVRTSSSQAAAEKHPYDFNGPAGANIAKFEPRRWLVKDQTTGREKFNSSALPLLAFGGGFRGCPGHKFAPMSIRIIFVILVLNLDFLDLPAEFSGTGTIETIFSLPDTPYARVKVL